MFNYHIAPRYLKYKNYDVTKKIARIMREATEIEEWLEASSNSHIALRYLFEHKHIDHYEIHGVYVLERLAEEHPKWFVYDCDVSGLHPVKRRENTRILPNPTPDQVYIFKQAQSVFEAVEFACFADVVSGDNYFGIKATFLNTDIAYLFSTPLSDEDLIKIGGHVYG